MGMRVCLAAMGLVLATGASAQTTSDKGPEKVICKRTQRTGSLVATNKECHTAREWELIAQAAQRSAQYEVDRQMSKSGGM